MLTKKLEKILESRKYELIRLIDRENIEKQTRQQILGAINEIDIFLRVLDEHKNFEIEDELKHFRLFKVDENDAFISNLLKRKSFTNNNEDSRNIGQES